VIMDVNSVKYGVYSVHKVCNIQCKVNEIIDKYSQNIER